MGLARTESLAKHCPYSFPYNVTAIDCPGRSPLAMNDPPEKNWRPIKASGYKEVSPADVKDRSGKKVQIECITA